MEQSWRDAFGEACLERRESVVSVGGSDIVRPLDVHQIEAMDAIVETLETTSARSFSIIHSTGSGKTTLEGNLIGASLEAKAVSNLGGDRKDLIITTERALINGVQDELMALGINAGMWGGGKKQLDHPVIVATIQALQYNAQNLHKILPLDRTDLVIGDEADLFLTQHRNVVIAQFKSALKVGFTATETWPDGRTVSDTWGKKIHELSLDDAILKGVNVPPFFHLFESKLNADTLNIKGGDYDQGTLEAGMKAVEIEKAISEVYRMLIPKTKRKNFPTLVYVPSVQLVHAVKEKLEQELTEEGVRVASWTGSTKTTDMEDETVAFKIGDIDILVLCEIGGRGLDLVRASCIIDAYPTLSRTKLAQRHGRVMRRVREGSTLATQGFQKPFALIAQIIPHANTFRPVCFPDLLEDPEAWNDVTEGRLVLVERHSKDMTDLNQGRASMNDINTIKEWIKTHGKTVQVTKIEELDVFAHLEQLSELPQANQEGFFEKDGKKFGTIHSWSRELGTSFDTVKKQLNGITAIQGKSAKGRISPFYPEDIVRERCAALFQILPQADESGFFVRDEKQYGTVSNWSKRLNISEIPIQKRLDGIEGIQGQDVARNIRTFFPEEIVLERCADLLQVLPQADEFGFFEKDGKRFGTMHSWSRELGISPNTILKKCRGAGIKGKIAAGAIICSFFDEDIVRERCADLLQVLPEADEFGFFEKDGKRFGTSMSWSKDLGVSKTAVDKRLHKTAAIQGRNAQGRICSFYPEDIVRQECKNLIG